MSFEEDFHLCHLLVHRFEYRAKKRLIMLVEIDQYWLLILFRHQVQVLLLGPESFERDREKTYEDDPLSFLTMQI